MKRIIFLVFPFLLVGCVTPSYNATSRITELTSRPEIGKLTTVGVGEQMLYQGNTSEDEILVVKSLTTASLYKIPSGEYKKTGNNEKGDFFSPVSNTGASISKSFIADPFQVLMVSKENELCVITVFSARVCSKNPDFAIKKVSSVRDNAFQQTLIYSGKVGNKINIGYREYSSNLARPAFNNDVEYDLNESKEIGYKGALLQIVNATNRDITYKVLKNFNKVD